MTYHLMFSANYIVIIKDNIHNIWIDKKFVEKKNSNFEMKHEARLFLQMMIYHSES